MMPNIFHMKSIAANSTIPLLQHLALFAHHYFQNPILVVLFEGGTYKIGQLIEVEEFRSVQCYFRNQPEQCEGEFFLVVVE